MCDKLLVSCVNIMGFQHYICTTKKTNTFNKPKVMIYFKKIDLAITTKIGCFAYVLLLYYCCFWLFAFIFILKGRCSFSVQTSFCLKKNAYEFTAIDFVKGPLNNNIFKVEEYISEYVK